MSVSCFVFAFGGEGQLVYLLPCDYSNMRQPTHEVRYRAVYCVEKYFYAHYIHAQCMYILLCHLMAAGKSGIQN